MNPRMAGRSETTGIAPEVRLQPVRLASAPPIRVLVAGADGFLGSHLLPRLESRGHLVRATFQDADGPGRKVAPGVDWREIDLTSADQVEGLAHECDVIVHLAGLFSKTGGQTLAGVHGTGTRLLLAEGSRAGVSRFVYVSVLGAKPGGGEYFCTKFDAESAVVASPLPSIVLRPSVIYGPGDQFTATIVRLLQKLPAFPMLAGGTFRVQPLAVEDMTDALIQCVERKDLDGRQFELAGPERLMFREIVGFVAEALGVQRPGLHVPRQLASVAAICARYLDLPAPFVLEQLEILTTGSVLNTEDNPLLSVFFVKPLPFRDAVADYLEGQE